jgi:hypothetical protein
MMSLKAQRNLKMIFLNLNLKTMIILNLKTMLDMMHLKAQRNLKMISLNLNLKTMIILNLKMDHSEKTGTSTGIITYDAPESTEKPETEFVDDDYFDFEDDVVYDLIK